ncbi:MAG: peptide chain release factor 2 [Bacillota bacterium]
MVDFYNEKIHLNKLKESVATSRAALNLEAVLVELDKLKDAQHQEGYWLDVTKSQQDSKLIATLEKKVESVAQLESRLNDITDTMTLVEEYDEEDEVLTVQNLLNTLDKDAESLFLETLLTGEYDNHNAILTLHAGAGGTEAQDWADMLYRMYKRYAQRAGYTITELDKQDGDEAGIKGVTFQLNGNNAYGFLKAEKGVHRLVRISPFDSNKRRHTSFCSLEVMPEIVEDDKIIINSEDLRIDTCRSSGAGGQHVNKTESAIRITHLPTGIVTWCQNQRSQMQNKDTAMKMLMSKLAERREQEQLQKAQDIQGELKKIEWGSQIRSYVFCPYTLVKDHRTGSENTNVASVMDGDIELFIRDYLVKSRG